jgi:hypothetical protein
MFNRYVEIHFHFKKYQTMSLFKKLSFSTFLFCCLGFYGCSKEEKIPGVDYDSSGLPIVTNEGRNLFGFLLDGVAWIPGCPKLLPTSTIFSAGKTGISADNGCDKVIERSINLEFPDSIRVDTFALSDSTVFGNAYYLTIDRNGALLDKLYSVALRDSLNTRLVISYHDAEKKIIAGNFQMTMYVVTNSGKHNNAPYALRDQYLDLTDSVVIRDGRFDIRYQ